MPNESPDMTQEQKEYLDKCIIKAFCDGYNQCRKDLYEVLSAVKKPLKNEQK